MEKNSEQIWSKLPGISRGEILSVFLQKKQATERARTKDNKAQCKLLASHDSLQLDGGIVGASQLPRVRLQPHGSDTDPFRRNVFSRSVLTPGGLNPSKLGQRNRMGYPDMSLQVPTIPMRRNMPTTPTTRHQWSCRVRTRWYLKVD